MPEKHECNKEFEWGVVTTSITETKADIAGIRTDQKEILKRINGLPVWQKAQDKSIGRLWKFLYAIIFVLGGGVLMTITTAFLIKL